MFKVGDAVRVKAGISSATRRHKGASFIPDMDSYIGKKLTVRIEQGSCCTCDLDDNDPWNYDYEWLEPWNDSEEWDGEKWVPKKVNAACQSSMNIEVECCSGYDLPSTTVNGVEYVRKVKEKTNVEKALDFIQAWKGKSLAGLYVFWPANDLIVTSAEAKDADEITVTLKVK